MNNLIDKIRELKKKFINGRALSEDVAVISSWEEEAKKLFLLKSLKDHDGIKYVLEIFQSDIKKINEQLNSAYSKDLKDTERDRLLDRRNLCTKYVNLFVDIDSHIELLEQEVDKEIS